MYACRERSRVRSRERSRDRERAASWRHTHERPAPGSGGGCKVRQAGALQWIAGRHLAMRDIRLRPRHQLRDLGPTVRAFSSTTSRSWSQNRKEVKKLAKT